MLERFQKIRENIRKVIRGKDEVIDLLLTALCAGGHVLIEDVPGVGKTTLAKALAASIQVDFRRIQFTPDLLPTDITGGMVYSPGIGEFTFKPGPIFAHLILADEINRASPRTQSALLEAMNEGQVTLDGHRYLLPLPFMVIATQNPIEYHGTYPLPEAQVDRFMMRLEMGYPAESDEQDILMGQKDFKPLDLLQPVASGEDIRACQKAVMAVGMEPTVLRYLTTLVNATRKDTRLRLGASPRAALALFRAAQAQAFLDSRDFVLPDDIKAVAVPLLVHRLIPDYGAAVSGFRADAMIRELLDRTPVPV